MKRCTFFFILLQCAIVLNAQKNEGGNYSVDIFGTQKFEGRDGFNASLSKNIFDDKIYEDRQGNKLKYSKKFLANLQKGERRVSDRRMLRDLIRYFENKKGYQEEFEVDIFDDLKYNNNKGFRATLSKNIFDDILYDDSNGNKIKFAGKFIAYFDLYDVQAKDAYLFMDILYSMMNQKNYREEFEIDIFDRVKYSNNQGLRIEIDDEDIREFYLRGRRGERKFLWNEFFDEYSN